MLERSKACALVGDAWHIGLTKSCEIIDTPPRDALAIWQGDGSIWCLRERPPGVSEGISEHGKVEEAMNDVWEIDGAFVKCSPPRPRRVPEYQIIRWLRACAPSVPVPEILYAWTEPDIGHFMITKSAGVTMFDAFTKLSDVDIDAIADQVAAAVLPLHEMSSQWRMRIDGSYGGDDPFGEWVPPCYTEPAAREGIPTPCLPPFTTVTYPLFIKATTGLDLPPLEGDFVLHHPDMHARNIVIELPVEGTAGPPRLTAILDWESVGYEPRWFPASQFHIYYRGPKGLIKWMHARRRAMAAHGSPNHGEWVDRYIKAREAVKREWYKHTPPDSVWPNLKYQAPGLGMPGYRWDRDERPEAKAFVAALTEEEKHKLWANLPDK